MIVRSGRASLAVSIAMEQSRKTGEIVKLSDIDPKA